MTLADYLNPDRFPLTAEQGLTPRRQFAIDAFHLAQLREHRDGGNELTDLQKARLVELVVRRRPGRS